MSLLQDATCALNSTHDVPRCVFQKWSFLSCSRSPFAIKCHGVARKHAANHMPKVLDSVFGITRKEKESVRERNFNPCQ